MNGREADLLLYGEIAGDCMDAETVGSRDVVKALLGLEQGCDLVRVRINSEGGDVYAGIAIFNALRTSRCNITIYTDGIAASIAGIIAMCGRKHYMSRYSRLMIHSVSGGVYGNKNDLAKMIDEIVSLEDTIGGIISERMGMSTEEVKSRYFDGQDHWFTAEEAVNLGLADGIYDVDVVRPDPSAKPDAIYRNVLNNRLAFIKPQTNNNMDIEKIKTVPRFANVASEDDAIAGIEAVVAENEALLRDKQQLQAEKEALEARIREIEDREDENLLDTAVKEGKIDPASKENYRNLLKADRTNTRNVLKSLKPGRKVTDDLHGGAGSDGDGPWDKRQKEIRNSLKR